MATKPRTKNPPAPPKLGLAGRALWRDVTSAYELRTDELRILKDCAFEADLIDHLEDELRGAPLIVKGSTGQPVANPLVQEVRQHRSTLARLLAQLKLSDEAAGSRSTSARAAARARWSGGP